MQLVSEINKANQKDINNYLHHFTLYIMHT